MDNKEIDQWIEGNLRDEYDILYYWKYVSQFCFPLSHLLHALKYKKRKEKESDSLIFFWIISTEEAPFSLGVSRHTLLSQFNIFMKLTIPVLNIVMPSDEFKCHFINLYFTSKQFYTCQKRQVVTLHCSEHYKFHKKTRQVQIKQE